MIIKRCRIIICILLFACTSCGCTSPGSGYPEKNTGNPNQLMEGLDKNIVNKDKGEAQMAGKVDNFSTEVRHWKYGVEQPATAPASSPQPGPPFSPSSSGGEEYDGRIVSMQFMTAQDLDNLQEILVQQGYLPAPTRDRAQFNQAIAKFQQDHDLPATGELDVATMAQVNQLKPGSTYKSQ